MTSPSSTRQRKQSVPNNQTGTNPNINIINTNPAAVPMSHFYGTLMQQQQYQHQQQMLLYPPYNNTAPAPTNTSAAAGVPLLIQYNHHAPPHAQYAPLPHSSSSSAGGVAAALVQDPTRKRQRRQTAGKLVMNALFGGNNNSSSNNVPIPQQAPPAIATPPSAASAALPVKVPSTTTTAPTSTTTATTTKKSKAQPRPAVYVAPRSIGPVRDPNPNDVLSGRGGRINAHAGNVQFREIVQHHKTEYLDTKTKKLEKAHIAAQIVYHIRGRNPPGRFLKEDPDGLWYDIGDQKAIKKVGQALREDAPELRGGDSDGKKAKDDSSASDAAEEPNAHPAAPATQESGKKKSDKKKVAEKKSPRKNVAASEVISALPGLTITAPPRSGGGSGGSAGDTTPRHHNYQPQPDPSGGCANLIPPSSTSSLCSAAKMIKSPPSAASSGTATAVSSRGGKVVTSAPSSSHRSSLEPVRVEIVLNPPPAYQQQQQQQHHAPVAPPPTSMFAASNSFRRRHHHHKDGRSVSGAAAAAMQDDHEFAEPEPRHMSLHNSNINHADEAFGMQFHPPNSNHLSNTLLMESSLLSGSVSDRPGESSMLSGMSGISALTDPLSALSGTEHQRAAQARRLDQVRQYWAAASQNNNNTTMNAPDPNSATIQMLQSSNGLGSSLLQMSVFEQQQAQQSSRGVFLADDAMSWTGRHSLVGSHNGGGSVARDDSSIMYGATTSSQLSGGSGLGFSIGALSAGLRSEQEYNNMILQQQQQQQQTYGSSMMDPLPVGNSTIAATGLPPMGRTNNLHLHPRNHSPFYNPSSSSSRGGGMRGMPAYHNHHHNNNYYYGGTGGGPNLHDGTASIAASLTSDNSEAMLSVLSENLHALDLADCSGHYNLGSNNINSGSYPYSGNTYQI